MVFRIELEAEVDFYTVQCLVDESPNALDTLVWLEEYFGNWKLEHAVVV